MECSSPHGERITEEIGERSPKLSALNLAVQFHAAYERLAPEYGYETRPETRVFDLASANGRLMIAVCDSIIQEYTELSEPVVNELIEKLEIKAKENKAEAILSPRNETWLNGIAEGLQDAVDILIFFRNKGNNPETRATIKE